jgi:threonine dehydratase
VVTYDRQGGEDRVAKTEGIAAERGMTLIPPFDDPNIMAGQGTIGLEVVEQTQRHKRRPDAVLVPCGGGGLTSGIATAIKAHLPETEVYAVEPQGFDDTTRSFASGERERNQGPETGLCDALLAPQPGRLTFPINQALCAGGLVVGDDEVFAAMRAAFAQLKLVAEPGGAVALAAALSGKVDLKGRVAVIVMSGGNVDAKLYARAITEGA